MTKTCATHEIGLDGFAFVALVAHQWDAIRYQYPPAYHLPNLMSLLSVAHKTAFYRLERKCLAAGWLKKEIRGRKKPSAYWVEIPERFEDTTDGPTEDSDRVSPSVSQSVSSDVSQCVSEPVYRSVSSDVPKVCPPSSLSLSLPLSRENAREGAGLSPGQPIEGTPDPGMTQCPADLSPSLREVWGELARDHGPTIATRARDACKRMFGAVTEKRMRETLVAAHKRGCTDRPAEQWPDFTQQIRNDRAGLQQPVGAIDEHSAANDAAYARKMKDMIRVES